MVLVWSRSRSRALDAPLPPGLPARLLRSHPHLLPGDLALVEQGLRQWFAVCARAQGEQLAMPSRVVDDLWHEFLVSTPAYERFCRRALGWYLHHTPEEEMTPEDRRANGGERLRRTYELAVLVDTDTPGLPLLFTIDERLGVEGGRRYVATCGSPLGCFPPPLATCLAHLPRRREADGAGGALVTGDADAGGPDGGCGGGCGGGGCGGGS